MSKEKIRIGMISAYFATMRGGGEHYTLHLSNALADLGYNITIICGKQPFKEAEPLSDRFKIEYVPQLYFLRDWGMKRIRLISFCASFIHYRQYMLFCYRHLVRSHEFDIIHTHDPESLHAAVKIKKKYNVPVVATFHGPPSPKHIKDVKSVDAVLPVSKEIKESFERYEIKNVYAIPGGVDLSHFKPMNKDRCKEELRLEGRVILFVGRVIPTKNIHNLLYAFKKVQSTIEDAKLLIVGDGVLKGDLMNTAKRLNIDRDVIFAGAVDYKRMPRYYNAADVFVLPSIFESFPLVALEAAACGVPLVISIGAKAFVGDFWEDAIFTVDPKSIDSISNGIIQALNDEVSKEKVELAQNRIKKYSWLERAKKVAEIYEMVMSR